ncbi:hypothetical protein Pelo_3394 [Pelomyxa schiedti]|nr:hypothetical protein Pelo_3394 [Pelomyxa schiedti]
MDHGKRNSRGDDADGGSDVHNAEWRRGRHRWAVWVSHVVWNHVVGRYRESRPADGYLAVWVASVGDGLWPLAPLACRALPSWAPGSAYTRLTWAALAGAKSCIKCLLLRDSKSRMRDDHKEVMAVLWGLCEGAHTQWARALAGDDGDCDGHPYNGDGQQEVSEASASVSSMRRWWREECGLVWPGTADGDRDLVELIRSHIGYQSLLYCVCENGHLETAKWVVERFRIRDTWEVAWPLMGALKARHLGVAEWLCNKFRGCEDLQWFKDFPLEDSFHSASVEVAEWVVNRSDLLQLLKWMRKRFPELDPELIDLRWAKIPYLEVIQWGTEVNSEFYVYLKSMASYCEASVFEWALENEEICPKISFSLIFNTCRNPNDLAPVVQLLVSKLATPLTRPELQQLLCWSLAFNNLKTANWIDDTFHVMDEINTTSGAIQGALKEICSHFMFRAEYVDGLQWFLGRRATLDLDESAIVDIAQSANSLAVTLLLLRVFPVNGAKYTGMLDRTLKRAVSSGCCEQVKQLVTLLGRETFTTQSVQSILTEQTHPKVWDIENFSSKTVKWLIKEYHLDSDQVKANSNFLLYNRLMFGKNHCAEWIIHSFDVTLQEVTEMMKMWGRFQMTPWTDLDTWRMLHRHFPSLTAEAIHNAFSLVLSSPVTALFVLDKFPSVTRMDLLNYGEYGKSSYVATETSLWFEGNIAVSPTTTTSNRVESMGHAVLVSHVVWAHVVPWWSNHCVSPASWRRYVDVLQRQQEFAGWLMGVGEGVWPLVPLACRALAALPVVTRGVPRFTRYTRLTWAALAGAKACIRWLLRKDGGRSEAPQEGPAASLVVARESGGGGIMGGLVGWVERRFVGLGKSGGGCGDLKYTTANRSGDKEIMAVLFGLCGGGHTMMAMALAADPAARAAECRSEGTAMTRWWREGCGLVWPDDSGGDRDLVELIRSRTGYNSLLRQVCENGHLDTAKWVVERFGIRESWEVALPLLYALEGGHLDVAKWLYGTVPSCESLQSLDLGDVFHSGRLDIAQWTFLSAFPKCSVDAEEESVIGSVSESTSCDDDELLRLCDWAKGNFDLNEPPSLYLIHNLAVMKWVVSTYGVGVRRKDATRIAFREPKIIEWILIEKAVPPTFDLLTNLCKNPHEPLSLTVVKDTDEFRDSVAGVEWLLRRCPTLNSSDETSVEYTIWSSFNVRATILLLEAFHIDYLKHKALLKMKLDQVVTRGSIEQVKKFVSLAGRDSITRKMVTACITQGPRCPNSSKVVKWLIKEFHLGEAEGKNHCAEWIIHSFGVTLNEFLVAMGSSTTASSLCSCDLNTLKMVMRVFPSITAKAFKHKGLMNIAVSSPVTAQFLMHKFPSSIALDFFRGGSSCTLPTSIWLGQHL